MKYKRTYILLIATAIATVLVAFLVKPKQTTVTSKIEGETTTETGGISDIFGSITDFFV